MTGESVTEVWYLQASDGKDSEVRERTEKKQEGIETPARRMIRSRKQREALESLGWNVAYRSRRKNGPCGIRSYLRRSGRKREEK